MRTLLIVAVVLVVGVAGVSYTSKSVQPDPLSSQCESRQGWESDFEVEGRVINAAGEVVAAAKVFVESDDTGVGFIPTGVSDQEGNFTIKLHHLGNYTVYGSKEEDGYPLTVSGFHQQVPLDQIPKLRITERKSVRNVVLQLGQSAAKIQGTIKDAVTNQIVQKATITLRRADNPDLLYRTSTEHASPGNFQIVVPTQPFSITVQSRGYQVWTYRDDVGPAQITNSLKLNRGELRKLQVVLRKHVDK